MSANNIVRRVLGESVEVTPSKDTPLPVIEASRPMSYMVCPHCKDEIHEKHTYVEGDILTENHITRHSDCGGAIQFPPPSPAEQAWLKKLMGTALVLLALLAMAGCAGDNRNWGGPFTNPDYSTNAPKAR